jgi:hypothetical protein
MNILERIDSAFKKKTINEEVHTKEPGEPGDFVNMHDPIARVLALRNSKGPHIGWDNYAAGKDYQPPTYFEAGSDKELGPKDTGAKGVTAPTDGKEKEIAFDGPSQYSERHGFVRPWSTGEILTTLMHVGPDEDTDGELHIIATKGVISRAREAMTGRDEPNQDDIEDAMALGAMAVLQILPKDEARPGVRFTSFIGNWMEQAMFAGAQPGYSDEYRRARGLRSRVEPAVKRAIVDASKGIPLDDALADVERKFNELYICPACKGDGTINIWKDEPDPDPKKPAKKVPAKVQCKKCDGKGTTEHIKAGPQHPFGKLLVDLEEVRDKVVRAITSGSTEAIKKAYKDLQDKFNEIKEEEDTFSSGGITTTGSVGKKPREHGALNAFKRITILFDEQRALAEDAIELLRQGDDSNWDAVMEAARGVWKNFKTLEHKKWAPDPNDPDAKEPVYVSPYESPKQGSMGLLAIQKAFETALKSKNTDHIKEFIAMSHEEQQHIRDIEQEKLDSSRATSLNVGGDDDDDEGEERSDFASKRRSVGEFTQKYYEIVSKSIGMLSPYHDDSLERKERASIAGKTLASIKSSIDAYLKMKASGQDTSDVLANIQDISKNLSPKLGEWKEEIVGVLRNLNGAIEVDDGFKEVKHDISDLQKIAKEDTKIESSEGSLTPQEYRLALRFYGIHDYPEKGTPQDPEIDEQGRLSKWAEAGYPAIGEKQIGREQSIFLWTDVFETTDDNGEPMQSVSNARISKVLTSAKLKIGDLARQLKQQIGEEFGYDSVDYQIISEFYVAYCRMVVEEIAPGSLKTIRG